MMLRKLICGRDVGKPRLLQRQISAWEDGLCPKGLTGTVLTSSHLVQLLLGKKKKKVLISLNWK